MKHANASAADCSANAIWQRSRMDWIGRCGDRGYRSEKKGDMHVIMLDPSLHTHAPLHLDGAAVSQRDRLLGAYWLEVPRGTCSAGEMRHAEIGTLTSSAVRIPCNTLRDSATPVQPNAIQPNPRLCTRTRHHVPSHVRGVNRAGIVRNAVRYARNAAVRKDTLELQPARRKGNGGGNTSRLEPVSHSACGSNKCSCSPHAMRMAARPVGRDR